MQAIILAAGYGKRMEKLGQNKPKAMLEINNKPLLEYLLEKIFKIKLIQRIYLISNNKFFPIFESWFKEEKYTKVKLLNDGTNNSQERLGAIADLAYVIKKEKIDDDILVTASDTLFEFDFSKFVDFSQQKNADVITAYQQNDLNELRRAGVIDINADNKVIDFEEKPQNPKTKLESPALYIYRRKSLPLIKTYLQDNNPDAPGNFVKWLYQKKDIYAFLIKGKRYHIGDSATYYQAKNLKSNEI